MAEYYVGWKGELLPPTDELEQFAVCNFATGEPVTEKMTYADAHEMLRKIQLLDKPAQKELDLWQ